MRRVSSYLKMRVLGAIESAPGSSIVSRIKHVSEQPFLDEDGLARPTWYLYDLDHDPNERENLASAQRARAEALFAELEERGWYVEPAALLGLKAGSIELDDDLTHQLGELGYGGGDDEGSPGEP